mgnify:CR=1 FL=1
MSWYASYVCLFIHCCLWMTQYHSLPATCRDCVSQHVRITIMSLRLTVPLRHASTPATVGDRKRYLDQSRIILVKLLYWKLVYNQHCTLSRVNDMALVPHWIGKRKLLISLYKVFSDVIGDLWHSGASSLLAGRSLTHHDSVYFYIGPAIASHWLYSRKFCHYRPSHYLLPQFNEAVPSVATCWYCCVMNHSHGKDRSSWCPPGASVSHSTR